MVLALVQWFDTAFLGLIQGFSLPLVLFLMSFLTFLGNPVFWFFVAAYVYWKGEEKESFYLINLVLFVSAVAGLLKVCTMRPRPSPEQFIVSEGFGDKLFPFKPTYNGSFPSAHSTMASGIAAYYWNIVNQKSKWLLALFAALIILSRILLGKHFLTDVLAGLLLGIFLGKAAYWSRNKLAKYDFEPSFKHEIETIAMVIVSIIALYCADLLPMLTAFIGFYAGFFSLRKAYPTRIKGHSLKKQFFGFAVLLAIIGTSSYFEETVQLFLYFLAGLWVSFIYPWLHHKFAEKEYRKPKKA